MARFEMNLSHARWGLLKRREGWCWTASFGQLPGLKRLKFGSSGNLVAVL